MYDDNGRKESTMNCLNILREIRAFAHNRTEEEKLIIIRSLLLEANSMIGERTHLDGIEDVEFDVHRSIDKIENIINKY